METLHKCLVFFLVEPNYSIPAKSVWFIPGHKAGMQKKQPLIAGLKHRTLQKRKAANISRFHILINLHLLALLIIGIFFPLPFSYSQLYYCLCMATGWLFYYTMDRWASIAVSHYRHNGAVTEKTCVTGLYALAGYNWKTRLFLLFLLASSIIATFTIHISFALLVGFSLRWLIESQLLEFVTALHHHRLK